MDQDDPELRIAELERQLAEQKRIAELERELADAKAADRAEPATGWQDASNRGRPGPEFTLDSSGGHVRTLTPDVMEPSSRRVWTFFGLVFVLPIAAVVCFCAAGASVTLKPSSALWMSGIVCKSGYHLSNDNQHYGTPSGGSGTTMSFRCASGASSYHANDFAILGLQFLLVGLVLCAATAVGVLMWRLGRKPATEPAAQTSPQQRRRRQGRVALIAGFVPLVAAAGIIGYLISRPSPSTTEVQSPSPTTTEPPSPALPVRVTYAVTGTKAPGDIITVTYLDASGRQHIQRNVDIPWTLTIAATSQSSVWSVQATSSSGVSRLDCATSTSDGRLLASNNNNSAQASC